MSGNVKVRVKPGNNNEVFIENVVTALMTVTIDGANASRTSYGAWHIDRAIPAGAPIVATDRAGRTISVPAREHDDGPEPGHRRAIPALPVT